MAESNKKINRLNIPVLDGNNYTTWSSWMKIFLCGKKVFLAFSVQLNNNEPVKIKAKYLEANNKAISYMVSRMNNCCYNEVIDMSTIDSTFSIWAKLAEKYALNSVVN